MGEFTKWQNEHRFDSDYAEKFNLITVIKITGLTKDAVKKHCDDIKALYQKEGWEYRDEEHLTDSEIEVLFSGDEALINKTFKNEYSLLQDGKVYSLDWLYSHSIKDYRENGISLEDAAKCLGKIKEDFPVTPQAETYIDTKIALCKN